MPEGVEVEVRFEGSLRPGSAPGFRRPGSPSSEARPLTDLPEVLGQEVGAIQGLPRLGRENEPMILPLGPQEEAFPPLNRLMRLESPENPTETFS